MVVSADIFIDDDVLEEIGALVSRFPALAEGAFKRQAQRFKARELPKLRNIGNYPPQPTLPFKWSFDPIANARARRWYFANKVPRGSAGGRYQRSGALGKNYDMEFDFDFEGDTIFYLTNATPGAEYVVGERQVPSHERSGWEQLDDAALRLSTTINEEFIDVWYTLSDPFAGVP